MMSSELNGFGSKLYHIKKTNLQFRYHQRPRIQKAFRLHLKQLRILNGFPGGTSGKEPTCHCRRQEMWVWSLGEEDLLEEGRATHSSILDWGIPWTEEPCGLQSIGLQRVAHDWSNLACTHAGRRKYMTISGSWALEPNHRLPREAGALPSTTHAQVSWPEQQHAD